MLALQIFLLILGLALLVLGADWFVDGGAGISEKCKISPLVIGLTIVAFGTSTPELAVSIAAAIGGSTDISIGNVVGSNIFNILLILGASSLIRNLPVQRNSLLLDMPVLLLSSALIIILGYFGSAVEWWDGLIMLVVFAVYLTVLLITAKKEHNKILALGENTAETAPETATKEPRTRIGKWFEGMKKKVWFLIILAVAGLAMVVGGGTLLVDSATYITTEAGVSERIIGLTVVAIGTSLPELVTSVVAAIKGETDIAVGNVIGSNIFNVLLVAGASSLFCPLTFTTGNLIDACVALGAAVLLFVCALPKSRNLNKVSGVIMTLCFVGYYIFLFLY